MLLEVKENCVQRKEYEDTIKEVLDFKESIKSRLEELSEVKPFHIES